MMKRRMMYALAGLVAVVAALPASAQFVLTPQGFVNGVGGTPDRYVIECPGAGQEELFRAVDYYMESQLAGPRTMFHASAPDSFTVNAFVRGAIADGKPMFRRMYDMEFRMMFDIRDGMVCVWVPEVKYLGRLVVEEEEPDGKPDGPGVGVVVSLRPPGKMERQMLFISREASVYGGVPYDGAGEVIFNRRGRLRKKTAKESLENYFNGLVQALGRHVGFAAEVRQEQPPQSQSQSGRNNL